MKTTTEQQKKYKCSFIGRKVGVIGKLQNFTIEVEAPENVGKESVSLSLYDNFEHITGLTIHDHTFIASNGSKWAGEQPDTIDKLIEVLKTETIEERFFESYLIDKSNERANFCPIRKGEDGYSRFFGNFEGLSHVFDISTNNAAIAMRLTNAIKKNAGWAKYYEKNLVK